MDDCPFCKVGNDTNEYLVALRTANVLVIPALKQRRLNRGHMLVVPTAHITRMIDLDSALVAELYSVAARVGMAVRQAFAASGVLLFQNEDIPGQVLHHVHVHVVPRSTDDNFRLPDLSIEEVSREERKQQALAVRRALG
jgi:histidine triad (HIT) family protein